MESDISMEEILGDMGPKKTGKVYNTTWQGFLDAMGVSTADDLTEKHFLTYFYNLKKNGQKASTLWTKYSMLNNVFQRQTGKKLQIQYPRLTMQLKSYQRGYTRKTAKTFHLHQLQAFMKADLPSPFWIVRKAFAAIAWSGGLRCDELHRLKVGSLELTEDGFEITYAHAKQLAEVKENKFLVPFNREDSAICLATKVKNYLEALGKLGDDNDSNLFKGCMRGSHFVKNPMGKNTLHDIGKDVAKELGICDWEAYTGHCWRRSSATQVAGGGATTVDMKRQFGWKQETTAMRYIDSTKQQTLKMATLATGQSIQSTVPSASATTATMIVEKQEVTRSIEEPKEPKQVYHITMGNNCSITFN